MLLGVPACMTNSMIKYMEIKIACLFRQRLTSEAVKQYMSGNTFYSVANLDGRLGNADQCLTNDIEKFCQHLSHLYVCVFSPRCAHVVTRRTTGTLKSASPCLT